MDGRTNGRTEKRSDRDAVMSLKMSKDGQTNVYGMTERNEHADVRTEMGNTHWVNKHLLRFRKD